MAHQKRQAIVEDRRAVLAGEGYQSVVSSGVCGDDASKAGRKESGQAVRETTQGHSSEDGEI